MVRCERLAPKTAVPQSAITANTVPRMALPTGMGAPPLLRSRAFWTPITVLGGNPVAARRPATTDGLEGNERSSGRKVCAARTAGQIPRIRTTTTVATAPSKRTSMSKDTPVVLSAVRRLTERRNRGQGGGDHHGAKSAGERNHQVPRHGERHKLSPIGAYSGHRRIVLALDDALAGDCLPDDRQPDQRGKDRQDPPSDGLRRGR